jgi:hypothetical protein
MRLIRKILMATDGPHHAIKAINSLENWLNGNPRPGDTSNSFLGLT